MPAATMRDHTEEPSHMVEEDTSNHTVMICRKMNSLEAMRTHLTQSQRSQRKRKVTTKAIAGAPLTRTISITSKVARTKDQRVVIKGKGNCKVKPE